MFPKRLYALLAASTLFISVANAQEMAKVQIGDAMEFPESITSTADGTLIAGSVTKGVIHKAAPGAAVTEVFIPAPAAGPSAVLGVYADEPNATLWVCYADMAAFGGGESKPSVLRSYDLASGEAKADYAFTDTSFCNDIATAADGTAYAADTLGGRVVRTTSAGTVEDWAADALLAGADGLSFGPDGHLYVNSVTTGKLLRIEMGADGKAGAITELALSEPLQGPDGMRFGEDGVLYLAENAAGRADAITIEGDTATVRPLPGDAYDFPAAVTKVGDTLWVLESKINKLGGTEDAGMFYAYPVALD